MSGNGNVSILAQYTQRPEPAHEESKAPSSRREYKAFGIDTPRNRTPMICIEYVDGAKGLIAKHYLIEVICTSSQYLTLIFTSGIITLSGAHLDGELLEKLQDEEIRSLHCFNAVRHDQPPENETIIREIKRTAFRELAEKKPKAG